MVGLALGVVTGMLAVLGVQALAGLSRGATAPSAEPAASAESAVPAVPVEPVLVLYVSPDGNDDGNGSADAPLRTIQAGLERATPGSVINLGPGVYRENPVTVRDGRPGAPITVKGPETGKDRAGALPGDAVRHRPDHQRQPQPLHLRRVHHRRPGGTGRHGRSRPIWPPSTGSRTACSPRSPTVA